jgi:hypothetical protein
MRRLLPVLFCMLACGPVVDHYTIEVEGGVVLRVWDTKNPEYHIRWMWQEAVAVLPVPERHVGQVIEVYPRRFMNNTPCGDLWGLQGCFQYRPGRPGVAPTFQVWYLLRAWESLRHEFIHVLLSMHGVPSSKHHDWMHANNVYEFKI